MLSSFFNFHGVGVVIESSEQEFQDSMEHDFSYFMSGEAPVSLRIHYARSKPDYDALPEMTCSFRSYSYGGSADYAMPPLLEKHAPQAGVQGTPALWMDLVSDKLDLHCRKSCCRIQEEAHFSISRHLAEGNADNGAGKYP